MSEYDYEDDGDVIVVAHTQARQELMSSMASWTHTCGGKIIARRFIDTMIVGTENEPFARGLGGTVLLYVADQAAKIGLSMDEVRVLVSIASHVGDVNPYVLCTCRHRRRGGRMRIRDPPPCIDCDGHRYDILTHTYTTGV